MTATDSTISIRTATSTTLAAAMRQAGGRPGDALCFDRPAGVVPWMIARAQKRMLRDLLGLRRSAALAKPLGDFARFVHVGTISGPASYVEQTSPRCREVGFACVPPGTRIRVRRVFGLSDPERSQIAAEAREDAARAVNYPEAELLKFYLWSWRVQKIALGRKFADVFSAETRDTCASSFVAWAQRASFHAFAGESPEAWYPARIAYDPAAFDTIAEIFVRTPDGK